ncbi:MAG: hypothetical protein ACKVQA_23765 [Burkholderiales bacterium]
MRKIVLHSALLIGVVLLAGCNDGAPILPFTTDGCSDFPDGTPRHRQIWRDCCVAHDRAYWRGGTYDERLEADRALQACVAVTGERAIARIMLAGVRVGGSPWWPSRFRWGYGWPWPRGYAPLTAAERAQANQALRQPPAPAP